LVMAIAAQCGLFVHQVNVVTVYLNAQLEEEVVMEIPEHMDEMLKKIANSSNEDAAIHTRARNILTALREGGNALKLKKALYGLRQAGRQWNFRLNQKLKSLGLNPTKGEPCLYVAHRGQDILLLLIYVDDILIASQNLEWIEEIKHGLQEDFKIQDLGLAERCLGFEIVQSDGRIALTQKGYIVDVLQRFGMQRCNPAFTPAECDSGLAGKETSASDIEEGPYRELIGALLYLSVATRPDIANTVARLAQFTSAPNSSHWVAAKRLLRYLAHTSQVGLIYSQNKEPLHGYSDSDWGGNLMDRRSFSGYAFIMGNAAITWKS